MSANSKHELHDVWEHDGDQMRKFGINDQVVPNSHQCQLTKEAASWGPRTMHDAERELFDKCDAFLVANSVQKKIFGGRYWFHELSGWIQNEDGEWEMAGYFGPFNAADLAAPTKVQQKDIP